MAAFDAPAAGLAASVLAAFGEPVTYQPSPPNGTPVSIFVARRTAREREPTAEGAYVVFFVRLSDLAAGPPAAGDLVTVKGVAYKVYDIDNDGQGGAELTCRKAA